MELLTHDELARLTPPERLALISQLWDSLDDDHLPLTVAQQAELDRRLATPDQDRREGITCAALKTEFEQRCSQVHPAIFTPRARTELIAAQDRYENEDPGLGPRSARRLTPWSSV
jgi:putative addiction module component (TIGR02574 family)